MIVLAGISMTGWSQVQFALGLKGGLNLSKFDPNAGTANVENRTGFHGGAFALVKVTKIGIQPEVLFSRQGSNFTFNSQNYEGNFDYINVPVMIKLYLAAGLNLQAGPQFGFLTIADLKNTTNSTQSVDDAKSLFSDKSDIGLAFGAGWDLPFGLTVDARYNLGFTDVVFKPTTTSSPIEFKNKVIQISLGYKLIKLGK